MAQLPTATPMSPTGQITDAPLAAETNLQPSTEDDVPKASQEIPALIGQPGSVPAPSAYFDTAAPTGRETAPSAGSENVTKSTTLVVHHLNNSRSQRLLWLLEELEVPYEIKKYQRTEEMRAPKELKDIHSLGKSPVITDGELTLAESGAITEYIISKYGDKFRPSDAGKIDDLYFTHYAEGSLMPILVNKIIFTIIPQRSPALLRPLLKPIFAQIEKKMLEPQLKAHCALIEAHLAKSKTGWLAGGDHPTSADFMMSFPAEALASRSPYCGPKTKEYVERIHQRPAYKRGIEKGGKYDYAKL